MFNRKSSYALNKKDPNAIVYMDANEAITRLTCEDFASEKEFLKWKSLSDEDYHASEKEAHVYTSTTRRSMKTALPTSPWKWSSWRMACGRWMLKQSSTGRWNRMPRKSRLTVR